MEDFILPLVFTVFLFTIAFKLVRKTRRTHYFYGYIYRDEDGYKRDFVRLNTDTGKVEFILWEKGEQGHGEDYWHVMGDGWENHFHRFKE